MTASAVMLASTIVVNTTDFARPFEKLIRSSALPYPAYEVSVSVTVQVRLSVLEVSTRYGATSWLLWCTSVMDVTSTPKSEQSNTNCL